LEAAQGFEARCYVLREYRGVIPASGNELWVRLKLYEKEISSYCKSVEIILKRSSEIAVLLARILEYTETEKLGKVSVAIRENVIALQAITFQSHKEGQVLGKIAQQSQKDSIALKGLTFIATIYLPAALVATIFSSNLIQSVSDSTRQSSSHFVVANQFWIFVVSTVGLTAVTIMSFLFLQHRLSKDLIL